MGRLSPASDVLDRRTGIPISLAVGHQALAFMLAGLSVAYLADLRRVR